MSGGWLVVWFIVLWGVIGSAVGRGRGRDGEGFLLGVLLGPIGVLLVLLMPPHQRTITKRLRAAGMKRCPHCAEAIQAAAVVCRYCSRDVPAEDLIPVPRPSRTREAIHGWYADPYARHELRWWNGRRWSDDVSDGGVRAIDPAI